MDHRNSELEQKVTAWAQQGMSLGWVSKKQAGTFNLPNKYNPYPLFNQANHRPLVIAFFGGTGVGKSTLFNRLANKSIVQTGVKRPTSTHTTVYHHHTVELDLFSKEISLSKVKTINHSDHHYKRIILIDVPDIDSVKQENNQQIVNWLPFIDVLVYVVSPEKYHDDIAWRILRNEAKFHHWVFVMNQWDKGVETQLNDFNKQLKKKGVFKIL